mmetsp:Transcript_47196/g.109970  ORF Transcript_47196/g.109970 Transcript_47196/m.109970 type:complete len:81 (+) Transcript_47196:84-326(+)
METLRGTAQGETTGPDVVAAGFDEIPAPETFTKGVADSQEEDATAPRAASSDSIELCRGSSYCAETDSAFLACGALRGDG